MQYVVECVLDNAWVKVRRYSTCNGTVYYCMEGDTMITIINSTGVRVHYSVGGVMC